MNILYYAPDYQIGGAAVYLSWLLKGLSKRDHTCTLICHKTAEIDAWIEEIKNYVNNVYRLEPLRNLKDIISYVRLARQSDVVHFNFIRPNCNFMAVLLAKLFSSARLIATNHLSIPIKSHYPFKAKLVSFITTLVFQMMDKVIVVSHASQKRFQKLYKINPEKLAMIYYGIEHEKYSPTINTTQKRGELDIDPEKIIIINVARLVPQKGHTYLINAAESVVKKYQNVLFLIVGEGRLRQDIENMVKQKGLDKYFNFLGFRQDIAELLAISDIFLLTSIAEGLPFAIQEAMAAGLPVVASRVDGNIEAVEDGVTGFLIDYEHAEDISGKLSLLIENPALRKEMGQKSKERAWLLFSLDKMVKNTNKFYSRK